MAEREPARLDPMQYLHLTHPGLAFLGRRHRPRARRATADLAEDSRDVAVADAPDEAVGALLRALGEPYASEMADGVEDAAG